MPAACGSDDGLRSLDHCPGGAAVPYILPVMLGSGTSTTRGLAGGERMRLWWKRALLGCLQIQACVAGWLLAFPT